MNIVAIYGLNKDKEGLAATLAALLGVTVYEALARLRTPGNGPLTVAVFAETGQAAALAERLQSGGFNSSVLAAGEIETEGRAPVVRKFSFGESEIGGTTEKGGSLIIPLQSIELILRGTAIVSDVRTETMKNRSVSPGRAVLSGGMMITKTVTSVRQVATEERHGFVNLYDGDSLQAILRENILVYDSLGPELRHSRAANFTFLIAELRRRCPAAMYDERLLSRSGQVGLLGPSLNPEEYITAATALLGKVLRNRT
jgi:hypothetical protein